MLETETNTRKRKGRRAHQGGGRGGDSRDLYLRLMLTMLREFKALLDARTAREQQHLWENRENFMDAVSILIMVGVPIEAIAEEFMTTPATVRSWQAGNAAVSAYVRNQVVAGCWKFIESVGVLVGGKRYHPLTGEVLPLAS